MKKILVIILVFVFLFAYKGQSLDGSSSKSINSELVINSELKTLPAMSAKPGGEIDSSWDSYSPSHIDPFKPIPPSSIVFLMDYTSSSTGEDECLDANSQLRQQIPLFFFSIARQRKEMAVALGVSYFAKGEHVSVVKTNTSFRENTIWYSKISRKHEPGYSDMYADVIEKAFRSSSEETLEMNRKIVVMIGDGSYAKDAKDEIDSRLAELNDEFKIQGKSLEFFALLFCVAPEQKEMWERLDDNQYVTVHFIEGDYLKWLPQFSKELMGMSEDEQFWLNYDNRNDIYLGLPADSIYRLQGVGLREGGLMIIDDGESIVETSHELPNWFLDQRQNWSMDANCGNRDVPIHYSGTGPVFHWLEKVSSFTFFPPSLKVYLDGDTNTAIVRSAVQQGSGMPGLENCYEPFLKIDGVDKIPETFSTPCNFEVCFENSHLVSAFDIGTEIPGGVENIEFGFRRKNEDLKYVSSELPEPFLITQNIKPNYLEKNHPHELKFDGKRERTFSIPIPILFFDRNKWDLRVKAHTFGGQNMNIEGLSAGTQKKCPGTGFPVSRETEKISINTDEKGWFEILMITNLGWKIESSESATNFDNYCGFNKFDVEFINKQNGQSVYWKCQQREDGFICNEERR